jgi:NAD(P)-dependent dehydrogenase (short-subunit alcohol dehydrogenase family)
MSARRESVFITGGTGAVGKELVRRFCEQGRYVKVVGRRLSPKLPAVYTQCDVSNLHSLTREMAGCDVVVHLAAVPRPGLSTPECLFHVNTCGTFRVYQAAISCGIKHIVTASSISALGCFFGPQDTPLHHFPIDEEHPTFTSDHYSFSKNIMESIGAYYHRREGITSIALRLPWVRRISANDLNTLRAEQLEAHNLVEDLLDKPDHPWIVNWRMMHARLRQLRTREIAEADGCHLPKLDPDLWGTLPDAMTWRLLYGRDHLWTAIDERDSARALELAVDAEIEGCHTLFVNDSRNWLGIESEKLLRVFYPEVAARKKELSGDESLVSIAKAQQLIGFVPQHHFGAPDDWRLDYNRQEYGEETYRSATLNDKEPVSSKQPTSSTSLAQ